MKTSQLWAKNKGGRKNKKKKNCPQTHPSISTSMCVPAERASNNFSDVNDDGSWWKGDAGNTTMAPQVWIIANSLKQEASRASGAGSRLQVHSPSSFVALVFPFNLYLANPYGQTYAQKTPSQRYKPFPHPPPPISTSNKSIAFAFRQLAAAVAYRWNISVNSKFHLFLFNYYAVLAYRFPPPQCPIPFFELPVLRRNENDYSAVLCLIFWNHCKF